MGTARASDLAGNTSQESHTDHSASSTLNTVSISNPLDIADTRGGASPDSLEWKSETSALTPGAHETSKPKIAISKKEAFIGFGALSLKDIGSRRAAAGLMNPSKPTGAEAASPFPAGSSPNLDSIFLPCFALLPRECIEHLRCQL